LLVLGTTIINDLLGIYTKVVVSFNAA
jgi:hypothetical protein